MATVWQPPFLTPVSHWSDRVTVTSPCMRTHISWQSHVSTQASAALLIAYLAHRLVSTTFARTVCGKLAAGSYTEAHLRCPAGIGAIAACAVRMLLLLQAALLRSRPPATSAASPDVPVAAARRLVDHLLGGGRCMLHSIAEAVQAVSKRWAQPARYAVAN
jgi:hypothetical protein